MNRCSRLDTLDDLLPEEESVPKTLVRVVTLVRTKYASILPLVSTSTQMRRGFPY